jgi:N-dimethylarginine dimethylaminohydrolase
MMTKSAVEFGPRLAASPTGKLRAAVLVKPSPAIEKAKPIPGEPGAIYSRTLEQHDILCNTLNYFGVETIVLDPSSDDPYEVAAADGAVAFEDGVVIMRPTTMGRRAQADRFEAAFTKLDVPLAGHIAAPGLMDGSDIVLAGKTAFVGVGTRGNSLGRSGFASVAKAHGYRVVEVALVPGVLSLRSVASAVAKDTVVISSDKVDRAAFAGFTTIELERGEDVGAGVICIGEHHVIANSRFRTSLARMRKAGIVVEGIDLYDFEKIGITPSLLVLPLKRD